MVSAKILGYDCDVLDRGYIMDEHYVRNAQKKMTAIDADEIIIFSLNGFTIEN